MTTWQNELRAQAIKLWQDRRGESLSFGDKGVSLNKALEFKRLIGEIAPDVLLDEEQDLGLGAIYPDEEYHLIVKDGKHTGAWVRGFVWSKYSSMREDPEGEIGVELDIKFQRVVPGSGKLFTEEYVMSCWGDDEKPRISAGVFVMDFAETGYEGAHYGTVMLTESDALRIVQGFKTVLE